MRNFLKLVSTFVIGVLLSGPAGAQTQSCDELDGVFNVRYYDSLGWSVGTHSVKFTLGSPNIETYDDGGLNRTRNYAIREMSIELQDGDILPFYHLWTCANDPRECQKDIANTIQNNGLLLKRLHPETTAGEKFALTCEQSRLRQFSEDVFAKYVATVNQPQGYQSKRK